MKILIIQTAFIGDVVLATALAEKLHAFFPEAQIDFLLRKGNEELLSTHPFIGQVLIWDKKKNKILNLLNTIVKVRKNKYDEVINVQRFLSSGLIAALSGAKEKTGFKKNPLSFLFTKRIAHEINGIHETERNQRLIEHLTDKIAAKPKLYPSKKDFESFSSEYENYICVAPASVWFTKQWPKEKWTELIDRTNSRIKIFLIGSSSDRSMCDSIIASSKKKNVENLAGELSLLQTAALMKNANMNYANDSAAVHIASAMNAPITAVYCSTIPEFGFGPLSEKSFVVQVKEKLTCRPCGLHGKKSCPEKHFKCALTIDVDELLTTNN
jgi:heptosyltransferase-2